MTAFVTAELYAEKTGVELGPSLTAAGLRSPVEMMIETASGIVADACRNDTFAVAPDGLPIDDIERHAMQWATVMQLFAMIEAGADPLAGDIGAVRDATLAGASLGSASYQLSDTGTQALTDAQRGVLSGIVPTAHRVLKRAGLASITIGL